MADITGTIRLIGDTQTVGSNGFTKRLLVVDTDEQYSTPIPVEFLKDKTSLLDNYKAGDAVKVSINLRGSEHQGKYYLQATGWRIEKSDGSARENSAVNDYQAKQNTPTANDSFQPATNYREEEHDDLPF